MKKRMKIFLFLCAALFFFADFAVCADLIFYPAKGQSRKQQEQDKAECYGWAKKQSGFDPMAQPTATAPPPSAEAPQGGVLRGGARGALVGLAAGAIAGDAGKGAAIGAATGGLLGGMRRRDQAIQQEQAQQQWAQQQAVAYQQNRANYDRAFGACMEGRGYTVK